MSPRSLEPPEFEDEYELADGEIVRSVYGTAIVPEPAVRVRRVRLSDGMTGPWKTIEWEADA